MGSVQMTSFRILGIFYTYHFKMSFWGLHRIYRSTKCVCSTLKKIKSRKSFSSDVIQSPYWSSKLSYVIFSVKLLNHLHNFLTCNENYLLSDNVICEDDRAHNYRGLCFPYYTSK